MLCFSSPRCSSTQCHLHHGRNPKSWTYQILGSLHHPPCPPSFPSNPMATPKLNLTNKRPFQGPSGMVKQVASWLPKTRVRVCGKKGLANKTIGSDIRRCRFVDIVYCVLGIWYLAFGMGETREGKQRFPLLHAATPKLGSDDVTPGFPTWAGHPVRNSLLPPR